MIEVRGTGNFNNLERMLDKITKGDYIRRVLNKYGRIGVEALASATPVDTGKTASSWGYEIKYNSDGSISIIWTNSNIVDGYANVAVLIQYGHATKNGGFVEGIDYINPAMKPIFEQLAKDALEEVVK